MQFHSSVLDATSAGPTTFDGANLASSATFEADTPTPPRSRRPSDEMPMEVGASERATSRRSSGDAAAPDSPLPLDGRASHPAASIPTSRNGSGSSGALAEQTAAAASQPVPVLHAPHMPHTVQARPSPSPPQPLPPPAVEPLGKGGLPPPMSDPTPKGLFELRFATSSGDESGSGALPWPTSGGLYSSFNVGSVGADGSGPLCAAQTWTMAVPADAPAHYAAADLAAADDDEAGLLDHPLWKRAEYDEARGGSDDDDEEAWTDDGEDGGPYGSLSAADDDDLEVDGLVWGGAHDALLPPLPAGGRHEHVLTVGCREVGAPYRLWVECVDAHGSGRVVSSAIVDVQRA